MSRLSSSIALRMVIPATFMERTMSPWTSRGGEFEPIPLLPGYGIGVKDRTLSRCSRRLREAVMAIRPTARGAKRRRRSESRTHSHKVFLTASHNGSKNHKQSRRSGQPSTVLPALTVSVRSAYRNVSSPSRTCHASSSE